MSYFDTTKDIEVTMDGIVREVHDGVVKKPVPLDEFFGANTPLGDPSTAHTDMLRTSNITAMGFKLGMELVEDYKSIIFITRPQFNLKGRNLIQDRKMSELLDKNPNSIGRWVRMTCDPRLGTIGDSGTVLESDLIDNNNPFIPIVTNSFVSMSGWPDTVTDLHVSEAGRMKEETMMVDGVADFYGKFDLDIEFKKIKGDPLMKLFSTWIRYPTLTYLGRMFPYYDFIRADEYDYNTRIYKLLLSKDGKYVRKIACTGASVPTTLPDGTEFNDSGYDTGPTEALGETHTIKFASVGAVYNDPITVLNFNKTVGYFSPDMKKVNSGEDGGMVKVPFNLRKELSNHPTLPRINPYTLELEYYIEKKLMDFVMPERTHYDATLKDGFYGG